MALGKTASSNPRVPALVRHGLDVESGLNDGLALPFFLMFLAAVPGTIAAEEGMDGVFWRALVVSTVVGLAIGGIGGRLLSLSKARDRVTDEWQQVTVLAVAFCAYSAATAVDGSGFIAAWTGGFAFGVALRKGEPTGEAQAKERPADLAEYVGGLLGNLSFPAFGAVLLGPALEHLNWRVITYAVLGLTVVGMLPVALALAGTGVRLPTVAYVGWFGPRGLASVVFGLLMVEDHVPGVGLMGQVVAVAIGLSVLLHGMSAPFFADLYGNWYDAAKAVALDLREAQGIPEDIGTPHGGSRRLR